MSRGVSRWEELEGRTEFRLPPGALPAAWKSRAEGRLLCVCVRCMRVCVGRVGRGIGTDGGMLGVCVPIPQPFQAMLGCSRGGRGHDLGSTAPQKPCSLSRPRLLGREGCAPCSLLQPCWVLPPRDHLSFLSGLCLYVPPPRGSPCPGHPPVLLLRGLSWSLYRLSAMMVSASSLGWAALFAALTPGLVASWHVVGTGCLWTLR